MNNLSFQKRRPIHVACEFGHLDIITFLLRNKCNIECEDFNVNNHYTLFEMNNL